MPARKQCVRCGKNRDIRFFRSPKGKVCTTCQKTNSRKLSRNRRVQETYNLTPEQYAQLFEAQNGKCAICLGTRRENLSVDHDHSRLLVRGLLCRMCNGRLLTAAKDDPEILRRAATYLENPPALAVIGEVRTPEPEPRPARRPRRGGGPRRQAGVTPEVGRSAA